MPPKRTAKSAADDRLPKRQRVTTPRPKTVDLDFSNTVHLVHYLLNDALQGNGREAPFYHGLLEAFTHFSRCSRDKKIRVSISAQYALCHDTYPDVEVTRDEPVATRSSNVAHHQALGEAAHDLANRSMSTIGSEDSDGSEKSAKEIYKAPDFMFWKAVINTLATRVEVSKLPFALVEVKPFDDDMLRGYVELDDMEYRQQVAQKIHGTRAQIKEQLTALWREFREESNELPWFFIFIFVGQYFAFYKVRNGATTLPQRGTSIDHVSCLLNDSHTDFSDTFQQRWKEMMNAYNIPITPGFLRV